MAFRLAKWYLDCVDPRGNAAIVYLAEMRWGRVTFRYQSVLLHAGGRTRVTSSMRAAAPPAIDGEHIRCAVPVLDLAGRFTARARPLEAVLLAGPAGEVRWTCHQPRAQAEIIAGGVRVAGLGYVEHLTITMPPWRLPIDELRWGRWLAEDAETALVWIDWRGAHDVQRVFLDGVETGAATVTDEAVAAEGLHLALADNQVLREGQLGATALAIIPAVSTIFPVRILATTERKWRGHGTLMHAGGRATGFAIHEVVTWPAA